MHKGSLGMKLGPRSNQCHMCGLVINNVGNADRHHYETYARAKKHGKLLHIDNGKRYV